MTIALAYAMPEEIASILPSGARAAETAAGVPFYPIEDGIFAYCGGIGKVNAAMAAQLCIDRFHPDWIVNAGVAGSFLDLPIGTVVLAERFLQHDVDTSPMGDPVGFVSTVDRIDFPTDHLPLLEGLLRRQGVAFRTGTVATGDAFMVRGERADRVAALFSPTLCEMEGGAIAQVCLRNGVPFTALKAVSDRLCRENSQEEYFNFAEAMARLNQVVLPLARALRDAAGSAAAAAEGKER